MLDQYYIYFILFYMLLINTVAFFTFKRDKSLAKNGKRRISEKTLLLSAIIGGGLGAVIGMHIFSHKTKKAAFLLGLPVIAIINIVLVMYVLKELV